MPRIKAFRGIHPAAGLADQLVVGLEGFSLQQAKAIRDQNPRSFMHLLVPHLDHPFQGRSKQDAAYQKIRENFMNFLEQGVLVQDQTPALYIYQVKKPKVIRQGIWAVSAVDDCLKNVLKKHELTRPDREEKLIEYLRNTGIDTNPVLVIYHPVSRIGEIITEIVADLPLISFSADQCEYKLWEVRKQEPLEELIGLFAELPSAYIADGHHRAAAAANFALQMRLQNPQYTGQEEYNFFSSVYMDTSQVKIIAYNRLVKGLSGLSPEAFLAKLEECFQISKPSFNQPITPAESRHYGMYLDGKWYGLSLKPEIPHGKDPVQRLDVSILQNYILDPILNIKDPRNDVRIAFSEGTIPVEKLREEVDKKNYSVAFTLHPVSIEQLMAVADAGEAMPPKSTWFEPKFFLGLLIHELA